MSEQLEISVSKVVRVIMLAREMGADHPHVVDYIGGLNEEEKAHLVAIMWVGRESFTADDYESAVETAFEEASAPTENYLSSTPELSDYLEDGLDALGISVADAEDEL